MSRSKNGTAENDLPHSGYVFLEDKKPKVTLPTLTPINKTHWIEGENEDKWQIPPPGGCSQAKAAIFKVILIIAATPQAGSKKKQLLRGPWSSGQIHQVKKKRVLAVSHLSSDLVYSSTYFLSNFLNHISKIGIRVTIVLTIFNVIAVLCIAFLLTGAEYATVCLQNHFSAFPY